MQFPSHAKNALIQKVERNKEREWDSQKLHANIPDHFMKIRMNQATQQPTPARWKIAVIFLCWSNNK